MQDEMLEYESEICPNCGNPRSICSDPDRPWYPLTSTCYATADREVLARRLQKQHESEPGTTRHPLDGLLVQVSPVDPDV